MTDVGDHADHLTPRIVGVVSNLLADGGRGRSPVLAREVLADQHDVALAVDVTPVELPAGDHPRPQHLEGTRRRPDEPAQRRDRVRGIGAVAGEDRIVAVAAAHRQRVDQPGGRDAWQTRKAIDERLMRHQQRRIVGRGLARDRDTQRLERRGIGEPGLHAPHRLVGPEHQAGSDQQHHGQRHLDDRQGVAGDVAIATGAPTASASLQRLVQPDTTPLEHRQGAEHETRGDRDDQREHDRRGVDADQIEARQPRRCETRGRPQGESGQAQSDRAANQAEQEALGQHVARQATAARTNGGAHGEFLGTPFGPHEQQVGDVRAGNQQDDADGRRHHPQALAEVADEIIDERADLGREARVFHHPEGHPLGRRELGEGDADHARHVRVDAGEVDARTEAADRPVVVARQPDIGPVEANRQHEIVRGVHEPEALAGARR